MFIYRAASNNGHKVGAGICVLENTRMSGLYPSSTRPRSSLRTVGETDGDKEQPMRVRSIQRRKRSLGAVAGRVLAAAAAALMTMSPADAAPAARYQPAYPSSTSFNAYRCPLLDPTIECEVDHRADAATGRLSYSHRIARGANSFNAPDAVTGSGFVMTYVPSSDASDLTVKAKIRVVDGHAVAPPGAQASGGVHLDVRHHGSPTEGSCCTSSWKIVQLFSAAGGSASAAPGELELTASLRNVPGGEPVSIVVMLDGRTITSANTIGETLNRATVDVSMVIVNSGDGT